jgi:hypothetical protein
MPDYQKGKIYKIVSNTVEGVYYGSTADTLWSRFGGHKTDYNYWKKGNNKYCTSFKLIEAGDAEIILIEYFPCNNKIELKARERWYIENNDCVNKVIPNRTNKEYYQDNREKLKEYQKLTFQCLCDGEHYNLHHRARHFKTQYHITNFKSICDIHGIDPNDVNLFKF